MRNLRTRTFHIYIYIYRIRTLRTSWNLFKTCSSEKASAILNTFHLYKISLRRVYHNLAFLRFDIHDYAYLIIIRRTWPIINNKRVAKRILKLLSIRFIE